MPPKAFCFQQMRHVHSGTHILYRPSQHADLKDCAELSGKAPSFADSGKLDNVDKCTRSEPATKQ